MKGSQKIYPSTGTALVPEYRKLLEDIGVTYRQWHSWRSLGYLPNVNWYHFKFNPELIQRAKDLKEAARLHSMTLGELADHIANQRSEAHK